MLTDILRPLFKRDLEKLRTEIELYREEKKLWYVEEGIANPAGNLCLHLVGNLNAFIGAELGRTGYVRQRDLEFSRKDVPRAELVEKINETIHTVDRTLEQLTPEALENEFPVRVFGHEMSTAYFLVHLVTHLNYHLGQINYHRRLLDE
ncbi:MAG: DinB family protein [Sinomicrobium sp.]|nr:DinB family protein [Sinomicrobium sp.]